MADTLGGHNRGQSPAQAAPGAVPGVDAKTGTGAAAALKDDRIKSKAAPAMGQATPPPSSAPPPQPRLAAVPAAPPDAVKAPEPGGHAGKDAVRPDPGARKEEGKEPRVKPQGPPKAPAPLPAKKAPLYERVGALLFYAATAAAIYLGWLGRDVEWIVPDNGAGYGLGIIGGAAMLLLLAYPMRKKWKFMRNWGPIKYWFRLHMAFGVIGPVLVLYHANFHLGSMNSNVVLISTLIVAGSGFIGRYLHAKVHEGLYGRQLTLVGLKKEVEANMAASEAVMAFAPEVQKRLIAFDQDVLKQRNTLLEKMRHLVIISVKTRGLRRSLLKGAAVEIESAARREKWTPAERMVREASIRDHVSSHVAAAAAVAGFGFFERMLSAWHLFHFPLFIMLVISGVVHVVAVHMF